MKKTKTKRKKISKKAIKQLGELAFKGVKLSKKPLFPKPKTALKHTSDLTIKDIFRDGIRAVRIEDLKKFIEGEKK